MKRSERGQKPRYEDHWFILETRQDQEKVFFPLEIMRIATLLINHNESDLEVICGKSSP